MSAWRIMIWLAGALLAFAVVASTVAADFPPAALAVLFLGTLAAVAFSVVGYRFGKRVGGEFGDREEGGDGSGG